MQSFRSRIWFAAVGSSLLFAACSSDSNGVIQDMGQGDTGADVSADSSNPVDMPDDAASPRDMGTDMVTSGEAGLTFVPTLGSGFKSQFDSSVNPFIPEDTSSDRGTILILLCAVSDVTCENPIVRAVANDNADEWSSGAPLQGSFGPTITVNDLVAGTWNLMVVYDSLDSQRRGYGWDDTFDTRETAWGGIVSATDLMLSDVAPSDLKNPAPVMMEVTLTDGGTLDLDKVTLSHYHEQAISQNPPSDDGVLVVGNATDGSLRLVDLGAYGVEEFAAGRYDFALVDGVNPVGGGLCNVIEGPGKTVYAIFGTANGATAGYAVQWDVETRTQVANIVTFPRGSAEAGPCRAIWHADQGHDYLFAVAAAGTNSGNKRGFWYADVTDLSTGAVDATPLGLTTDNLFDQKLQNIAAFENRLFIGTNTDQITECGGTSCAFEATFDTSGMPSIVMETNGDYRVHKASALRGDVKTPELGNQTVSCADVEQGVEYFGLKVVEFKKTSQNLLLFGNCHVIDMMDVATDTFLDFDTIEVGTQGLNAALFGGGFYGFELSPDGDTLWTVSANKSRIMHSIVGNSPVDDLGDARITVDRHALLPIDLSAGVSGTLPEVAAEYTTTNRDGFSGTPEDGINDLITPEFDPGIDVRGLFLKAHYVFWNKSLSGSLPNPFPVGPSLAVTNKTVWMRGSGAGMSSALGQGANLSVFDLDTQRLVLWAPADEDFYSPFLGLQQQVFGFDLTPAVDTTIATGGIVYIP